MHFLLVGIALLGAHELFVHAENTEDPRTIVVDRAALLNFIQYRTKVFEPDAAAARLDGLSEDALTRVINDFVQEEALYREAQALGLARDDYVIKQRMIQKVDFITQGFAEAAVALTEEDLERHFAEHRERYFVAPLVTFTPRVFRSRAAPG